MRFSLFVPLTLLLTACGGPPGVDDPGTTGTAAPEASDTASLPTDTGDETGTPDPTADSSSQTDTGQTGDSSTTGVPPEPEDPGVGWSIRDDDPYGRVGHAAILDEAGDRMIVFGGAGNDTWELPLAGPRANEWSELVVQGEHPPANSHGNSALTDSAVYDPAGQRMIVLINSTSILAAQSDDVQLWELSLAGAPKWRRLVTAGPDPAGEVQSGRIVLDRDENRLFVIGGAVDETGVWTLSLADPPTWERFADTPVEELPPFYADASLLLDAERGQLVLFGGHPRLRRVWGLSLATAEWTLLDDGDVASESYGVTATLDAANDRVIVHGGDKLDRTSLFSLATHTWTAADAGDDGSWPWGASGVLDPQRGRVVYFSGMTAKAGGEQEALNTTWAFSLDDLALSELVPATRRADLTMGERSAVWDPVRGVVVAFGGHKSGETWTHGLAPADGWTAAAVGVTPSLTLMAAIHDPVGEAIIAFGGYASEDSDALARLASSPGAVWEALAVDGGPAARARHVAVYDAENQRMIIHGGRTREAGEYTSLGDTWALSLDGAPVWTELAAAGPPARHAPVAIYDPVAQRMIVHGGLDASDDPLTDVWSLSLTGAPVWTQLLPTGTSPGAAFGASAVHDPHGHRMIVVDLAPREGPEAARVFALGLDGAPAWHRFCDPGLTPADLWGTHGTATNAVLVDDGLFVTISGGALRFDLQTPYCD
jgi:hypothetical protein